MSQDEMKDIHKIIMKTLRIVPKAYDMNGKYFNSDCHMELTERTFHLVSERFSTTEEEAGKIVERYLALTGGKI